MTKCDFCPWSTPEGDCSFKRQDDRAFWCGEAIDKMVKALKGRDGSAKGIAAKGQDSDIFTAMALFDENKFRSMKEIAESEVVLDGYVFQIKENGHGNE